MSNQDVQSLMDIVVSEFNEQEFLAAIKKAKPYPFIAYSCHSIWFTIKKDEADDAALYSDLFHYLEISSKFHKMRDYIKWTERQNGVLFFNHYRGITEAPEGTTLMTIYRERM
jgi:hypothetical protein